MFAYPDFPLGPLIASFFLGFATIALLYWYSTKNYDYWKKKGVPHPRPYPLFGSFFDFVKKPFHQVELDRCVKYGPIYGHYEGRKPVLSVAEPSLLKDILVKDFQVFTGRRNFATSEDVSRYMVSVLQGEDWKRVRTIITPTFTTGKIKRMISIFKDCSKTLIRNFRTFAEKGEPLEAKSIYGAFTMDVIASAAFSTKIDSHNDPNNAFIKMAIKLFPRGVSWRFIAFIILPSVTRFFKIGIFSPVAMKFFTNATLQIIHERKRTGQKRNDFLQLLMDTAEELAEEGKLETTEKEAEDIATNYGKIDSDQVIKNINPKKTLSFEELVAQCVIFFFAGYETTASTLSFVTYNLALNPDAQEKLIAEVDAALSSTNGELTYEVIQNMKYLDNVISETLRLYPPAIRLERVAEDDYTLGDTGITIPKGMIVTMPVYALHRNPRHYPDPDKFNPDRFNTEEREKRDPYAYLPFGAGPRNCVGMRFALMEMKVCLANVFSQFRFKTCPQTKVPLEFYVSSGLLQPKAVMVQAEIRKDKIKSR